MAKEKFLEVKKTKIFNRTEQKYAPLRFLNFYYKLVVNSTYFNDMAMKLDTLGVSRATNSILCPILMFFERPKIDSFVI